MTQRTTYDRFLFTAIGLGLFVLPWSLVSVNVLPLLAAADEKAADTKETKAADEEAALTKLKQSIVAAAGGEGQLLRLFRFSERLAVSADPQAEGKVRESIAEPPHHWWSGKRDRVTADKEPAAMLVWAWTLTPLVDPKSRFELLPEIKIDERPMHGLRILSIDPPMDMYFDQETLRLTRIDWRTDHHVFSDWRKLGDLSYPAKCVGLKKANGKHWYHTEILEVERLTELPAGLER